MPKFSKELEIIPPLISDKPHYVNYYAQGVNAGFPLPADSVKDVALSLDDKYLQNPESTFLIRVVGDSMFPTLQENDILIVKSNIELTNNCIAILSLNESAFTVKRFDKKQRRLLADNKGFDPIQLGDADTLISLGVVKNLIRDV